MENRNRLLSKCKWIWKFMFFRKKNIKKQSEIRLPFFFERHTFGWVLNHFQFSLGIPVKKEKVGCWKKQLCSNFLSKKKWNQGIQEWVNLRMFCFTKLNKNLAFLFLNFQVRFYSLSTWCHTIFGSGMNFILDVLPIFLHNRSTYFSILISGPLDFASPIRLPTMGQVTKILYILV